MFKLDKSTIFPTSGFCLWTFLFPCSLFFLCTIFLFMFSFETTIEQTNTRLFMNTGVFGMCHGRQRSRDALLFTLSLCVCSFPPIKILNQIKITIDTRFLVVRYQNNHSTRHFLGRGFFAFHDFHLHDFRVYIMSECEIKNLCCLSSLYGKAIQSQCFLSIVEYVAKL